MKRVLVVGPCGAGKSTVARELGRITGLPVVHLDRLFWKAGWRERGEALFRRDLRKALARPRWITDGQYSRTLEERLAKADTVIHLDLPRRVYFWRVLMRVVRSYGRVRPDMAPGCPEKFDWAFLKWAWTYPSRDRGGLAARLARLKKSQRWVRLKSAKEVSEFLESL